jgi:hypothetical protein
VTSVCPVATASPLSLRFDVLDASLRESNHLQRLYTALPDVQGSLPGATEVTLVLRMLRFGSQVATVRHILTLSCSYCDFVVDIHRYWNIPEDSAACGVISAEISRRTDGIGALCSDLFCPLGAPKNYIRTFVIPVLRYTASDNYNRMGIMALLTATTYMRYTRTVVTPYVISSLGPDPTE